MALSTMKASHFVRAFEQEVDRWERQLSVVLEVTEMVLTVQRQWIYLEVSQLRLETDCHPQASSDSSFLHPSRTFSRGKTSGISCPKSARSLRRPASFGRPS